MPSPFARAQGLAAALLASTAVLLPTAGTALADPPAPDPVAACDGTPYTVATFAGRHVVRCDDGATRDWQRVAIADADVTRSASGATALTFTVSRPEAGNPVFLSYATGNGTATAPADYTAQSGQLVLESDETTKTVTVAVPVQTRAASDKTLTVALADDQGDVVAFDRARAVGTLGNTLNTVSVPDADYLCDGGFYSRVDLPAPWTGGGVKCLGMDPQPHGVVDAADVAADPSAGSVTFTLNRAVPYGPTVISYQTVDGSARAGVDYVATSGVVLAATNQPGTRVTVPLLANAAAGGDRSFSLSIGSGWSYIPVSAPQPVATIRHLPALDGEPRLGGRLTGAPDATSRQWERCDAAGACREIVGATGASYQPTTADLGSRLRLRATYPASDGQSMTLRTPATPAVFTPAPDPVAACDGTPFTTATVDGREVVSCDDGATRDWQRVGVEDAVVTRDAGGGATLRFTVARRAAGNPLFVRYGTADGTGVANVDYTPTSGVLVLDADQTSGTVEVPVRAASGEGADLTVRLSIGDERDAGAELLRGTASGTIRNTEWRTRVDAETACDGGLYDLVVVRGLQAPRCLWAGDDPRTAVWFTDFTVSSPVVDPRAGVATFEVRRAVGGGNVWLRWETVDGTARAGVDYVASGGELRWSSGQLGQRVSVPLRAGSDADGDRSFALRVTTAEPAIAVEPAQGSATIRRFTPALAGTPRVGSALTGAAPGALGRQWQRCDDHGACWAVDTATGTAYTPTADDLGRRLRVRALVAGDDGIAIAAETPVSAPVRSATIATPTLTGGPAAGSVVTDRSATFTLGGKEDDAVYECSLDGAAYATCGDGAGEATIAPLASGRHTLTVRQRTVDGKTSTPTAERAWTVAAVPDGAAACDGTPFTTATVDGRAVVSCDDGAIRDWQRVTVEDATAVRSTSAGTTLRFTVTRRAAGSPIFLGYTTTGVAASGVLVLEADQARGTVEVPVPAAADDGDDATVGLTLTDDRGAGVEFLRGAAVGTLRNAAFSTRIDADEACSGGMYDVVVIRGVRTPRCLAGSSAEWFGAVSVSAPVVDPRAGVATFTLSRPVSGGPLYLNWETVDGSATAGVDYVSSSGQLTVSSGRRTMRLSVPLVAGAGADADGDRAFALRVTSDEPQIPVAPAEGTATIRNVKPGAIAGVPTVGETLTAETPEADRRQWQRCDAQGACWTIAGATATTYAPTSADVGLRLRVRVTTAADGDAPAIVAFTPLTDVVAAPGQPRAPVDPRPPTDPRQPVDERPPLDEDPPRHGGASRPAYRVTGRRQQNRDVGNAVAGTTNVVLRCSAACRLRAPLTVSKAAARRLGLRSTRVGVADGRTARAGLVRLQVRLAARERTRLLAIGRPVTVVARVPSPTGRTVTVRFRLLPRWSARQPAARR